MTGKRELILARFNWILARIPLLTATRNEVGFTASGRPIANQMDGDEDVPPAQFDEQAHAGIAKTMLVMLPTVEVLIGDRPDATGPVVNEWRATIVQAILADAIKKRPPQNDGSLGWLVGMKGYVKYNGLASRFTRSYNVDADMTLRFAIYTVFDPNNP